MIRKHERLFILLIDFISINAAYLLYYWFRIRSGLLDYALEPELIFPMFAIFLYWIFIFWFFGLYRSWYAESRLSELLSLFKTTIVGSLILFFVIFIDDLQAGGETTTRLVIIAYWITLFSFVSLGRISIRTFQRRLLEAGIGAHNTLIIGTSENAFSLCDMAFNYPALGYKPIGFVAVPHNTSKSKSQTFKEYHNTPLVGSLQQLPELIDEHNIKEIFIGLEPTEHDFILEIIRLCEGRDINIKIMPDMYNIVSGQARINSLYGFPLMQVNPVIMKPWEESLKRFFDVVISVCVLIIGLPFWILNSILIKLDSKGTIFYYQDRVGKSGRIFEIVKFRSMISEAEKDSGPVWANKNDSRVTRWGRIMRKTHIDEVPQFWNVLVGEMSLVGPRPERPVFVEQFAEEIPLYKQRLRVKPGITGWAQVKHTYDQNIEDVKTKLKHDSFYIENMSWRMDIIIVMNTAYAMIRGKGHT